MRAVVAQADDRDGKHGTDNADGDPGAPTACVVLIVTAGLAAALSCSGAHLCGRLEGVREVGFRAQETAGGCSARCNKNNL
jgi:hypothetical protein